MKTNLLAKRYRVEADYPQSDLPVGTILTNYSGDMWGNGEFEFSSPESYFKKYPHIFKEISWWEERSIEDMPDYVSYVSLTLKEKFGDDETKTRKYVRVVSWHKNDRGLWYYNDSHFSTLCHSHLPATESEFTTYINQIKS